MPSNSRARKKNRNGPRDDPERDTGDPLRNRPGTFPPGNATGPTPGEGAENSPLAERLPTERIYGVNRETWAMIFGSLMWMLACPKVHGLKIVPHASWSVATGVRIAQAQPVANAVLLGCIWRHDRSISTPPSPLPTEGDATPTKPMPRTTRKMTTIYFPDTFTKAVTPAWFHTNFGYSRGRALWKALSEPPYPAP